MPVFHLTNRDGRAVLDTPSAEYLDVLQTIEATNWQAARNKVDESLLYRDERYGWRIR